MDQEKRLVVELPDKDHRTIKELAAQEGISMKRWILKAVAFYLRGAHGQQENISGTISDRYE